MPPLLTEHRKDSLGQLCSDLLLSDLLAVSAAMAPMKLAIIGGGPSAFYVASRILSLVPASLAQLRIHMYDRLWAPHGLVRYGVAPDHPEVKASTR